MSINIACPKCGASYEVPDNHAGKSAHCKKCSTRFSVTSASPVVGRNGSSAGMAVSGVRPSPPRTVPAAAQPTEPATAQTTAPAAKGRSRLGMLLGVIGGSLLLCTCCVLLPGGSIGVYYVLGKSSSNTYGAIEISSTAVTAVVVEMKRDGKGNPEYHVLHKTNEPTNLEAEVGDKRLFDEQNLRHTHKAVSKFFDDIRRDHKVPAEQIFIVGSSGMFPGINDPKLSADARKDLIAKNRDAVREWICKPLKRPLEYRDVKDEVEANFKTLVRKDLQKTTLFIDMGSSACRGATMNPNTGIVTAFNITGVKKFQKAAQEDAKKFGGGVVVAARRVGNRMLRPELQTRAGVQPDVLQRPRVHLAGGIPWVVATHTNAAGRDSIYARLDLNAIRDFSQQVQRQQTLPEVAIPPGADGRLRKTLQEDGATMSKIFPPPKTLAGIEFLTILADEWHFGDREIFFNDYGNISLPLSIILEQWEARGKR